MEKIGKIYDLVNNKTLSKHQLVLNLCKVMGFEIPKLPPPICKCKITLKSGKSYIAILEYKTPPFYYKDDDDKEEYFWKVLSLNPIKRIHFGLSEVEKWELV